MEGYLSVEQLKEMDRKQLQALAKDMGVSAAGKNEEIIERIASVKVKAEDEGTQETAQTVTGAQEGTQADGNTQEDTQDATGTQEGAQTVTGTQEDTRADEDAQTETTAQGAAAAGAKVIVTEVFRDKTNGKRREVDEVIEVTEERAAELIAAGVVVRG